jgi:hypothetical protein
MFSSAKDAGKILTRVESKAGDEKTEEWLQSLIFDHPNVLPVDYFDEAFTPLIPIARELSTPSGSIDIFLVSPLGRITIVETKLWKNPEQHRTVVAQVIDYAKDISGWSYDELNTAVLKTTGTDASEKKSLAQVVQPFLEESGLTVTDFQERLIATLRNGEFLLLIVGDRISPNVALLSEAVHGAPGLDFRLGLVELGLYLLNDGSNWPLVVIPDIVGRTLEETRGVIRIQYLQEKPKVEIEISEEEGPRPKTTAEIFLNKAPQNLRSVYEQWLEVWEKKNFTVQWGTVGFSLRVVVQGKLETILDAYPEWAVSLIRESDAERCGVSQEQYQAYLENISSVPKAVNLLSLGKKYITHDSITNEDLMTILKAATEFGAAL